MSRALKKIQVGVPAISMGNIIIFFTKEAKIYEKHGLDADPVVMSGSGIASRALIAGSVADFADRDADGHDRRTRRFRHGDFGAHDAGGDSIFDGAAGH